MPTRMRHLATIAMSAALLTGCAPATHPGGTVNATLTGMRIVLDRGSVPAGPVTFVVTNTDRIEHGLVVLKTDVAQDRIAADRDEPGKMREDDAVGKTGHLAAAMSKTFVLTLPAGHYVLMCNELGHYDAGMHLAFTVN